MNAIFKNVQHPYELDGNPTIYFAPKNSKNNPRKYDVKWYQLKKKKVIL